MTASELILSRADPEKPYMALTSWKGSIVRKQDIFIAKNYLTADELDTLNRLVIIFLETAELQVKSRKDITLTFWRENVDSILKFNEKPVLESTGKISHEEMEEKIREMYSRFDNFRKACDAQAEDNQELQELIELEHELKKQR
jgi:hypothetical protein